MPEFSSSKIILHYVHIDNNYVESGIGYYIIIGRDVMVQLGLSSNFNHRIFQCYSATVPIKEPIGLLGQIYLTSHDMRKLLMQTAETVFSK